MKFIRIQKGFDLHAAGRPSLELQRLEAPETVAFIPKHIRFIKPRLAIKEKDSVKVGSLLFSDKHRPDLKFRSPGAGIVETVHFGPRRILEAIVIRLDSKEEDEIFSSISEAALDTMDTKDLVARIQEGGLWALIRELPFKNIPFYHGKPPGIIVTMGTKEPFEPEPSVYLRGREDLFQFGIRVLKRLTANVDVVLPSGNDAPDFLHKMATHKVSGKYPCGDAGVLLYWTKIDLNQKRTWYIHGQDVLLLARLLRDGRYPIERTVVLAGPDVKHPCHIETRMGAPLSHLAQFGTINGDHRFVVGGLFTGYPEPGNGYLSFHETAVAVLPNDKKAERFALFKPGYHKPTYSRAFISRLNPSPMTVDGRYHGEERACIGCGYCANVCPVDILPQFAFKTIIIGEMEEALKHGILDCVECGLCSHVCPSKIDLAQILKTARADLYKEMVHR